MPFVIRKTDDFNYASPQEMYQDNKFKKIMGPLDYQSAMLNLYMQNYDQKTIALELPTGSGKTLVGLLIGEYRRRKNKEKVLFLCPTNQLVHQVATQANQHYGLQAIPFCGKQKTYETQDKTSYLLSNAIGITTYSSFFAQYTFFQDVDIILMDDVHSCEDYIVSSWTIKLEKDNTIFLEVAELLRPIISETDYMFLVTDDVTLSIADWCNLVPMPLLASKLGELQTIFHAALEKGTANYYAYSRLAENLQECNLFIRNGLILIRPWIAPTLTHEPFNNAKQRVLMSATLGRSGELERITGIEKICRLPIVNDWDKKGLGRKFFVFPDLSLGPEKQTEVIMNLQNCCKRSVFLVPDSCTFRNVKNLFDNNLPNTNIFDAKDIEQSKDTFIESEEATVILTNRFDGVDFPDEDSRLLFIHNLPKTTNIQEKFLITRMGASLLYAERIRTRIIQAVGRCSRNPGDYSVVCMLGDTIQNDITKQEKLKQFPPELHAELQFGLDNSEKYNDIGQMLSQVEDFLARNEDWQAADTGIVDLRNSYWVEKDEILEQLSQKLHDAAKAELRYQYALWKKDYSVAFTAVSEVVSILDAPRLSGYKSFWNFLKGSLAYYIYQRGKTEYKAVSIECFKDALKDNISVRWLSDLSSVLFSSVKFLEEDDMFGDVIERLESVLTSFSSAQKLEKAITQMLTDLRSKDGKDFERGHKELGYLLGYISENPDSTGAPDPYWIINPNYVIVAEDKIYEEKENEVVKEIPISDVSEAVRHKPWVKENEKRIVKNAEIVTVFITNSQKVDNDARIYAEDIYYIERSNFVQWAVQAVTILREVWNTFIDEGNSEWRTAAHQKFSDTHLTPADFLAFVKSKALRDI